MRSKKLLVGGFLAFCLSASVILTADIYESFRDKPKIWNSYNEIKHEIFLYQQSVSSVKAVSNYHVNNNVGMPDSLFNEQMNLNQESQNNLENILAYKEAVKEDFEKNVELDAYLTKKEDLIPIKSYGLLGLSLSLGVIAYAFTKKSTGYVAKSQCENSAQKN